MRKLTFSTRRYIRRKFPNKFRILALKMGINFSKSTPLDEVAALIEKLKPCGGNLIRIGGQDGGYLIPDDLKGIKYCFSPGVGETSTFEEDLLKRGINSYLADNTVDAPPPSLKNSAFKKKNIGVFCSNDVMTLDSWVGNKKNLILQMDIEGSEYSVLANSDLTKFRIMIVEFHNLCSFFHPESFRFMQDVFLKILEGFNVVHIHPNNKSGVVRRGGVEIPSTMEFTFLRKDRPCGGDLVFPHPLDKSNDPSKKDIILPKCWYAPAQG